MRIRHLVSFLTNHPSRRRGSLNDLKHIVLGIDAVYWLRSLTELKDPYSVILGGTPFVLFATIDKQLDYFESLGIEPIFVFEGIQNRTHGLFVLSYPDAMEEGWLDYAAGKMNEAQQKFLTATSRITTDSIFLAFHYLKSKNIQCIQGPYFSCSQLSYLYHQQYVDALLGPPALFLYDVHRLILSINWMKGEFNWVDFNDLLKHWELHHKQQFVDACLLSGTEICLTHPYLELKHSQENRLREQQAVASPGTTEVSAVNRQTHNLPQTQEQRVQRNVSFTFQTSIECVKHFPLPELFKFEHVSFLTKYKTGYANCRSVVQFPLFLRLDEAPNTAMVDTHSVLYGQLPSNFSELVGKRLPNALYLLVIEGVISRKLPSVLALGEWLDNSFPAVSSVEYYESIVDVEEYRSRALGLIAQRLPAYFQTQAIEFQALPKKLGGSNPQNASRPVDCSLGYCWSFTAADVKKEQERQGRARIDWKFVLVWFAYAKENSIRLWLEDAESIRIGPNMAAQDMNSIIALIHFMVLENLKFFTRGGELTAFGAAMAEVPVAYQEDSLCLLEMMKFGIFMGEPLEALPSSPFPQDIKLVKNHEKSVKEKRLTEILLISRVLSLYRMRLNRHTMWKADIDFDLAGFHSVVKVLMRALRHITEGCLANILLKDISKIHLLPPTLYQPDAPLIPCFCPRPNCMGIVAKFFLEYPYTIDLKCFTTSELSAMGLQPGQSVKHFNQELKSFDVFKKAIRHQFPCCIDAISDLCGALDFWMQQYRMIHSLHKKGVNVQHLRDTMRGATELIKQQSRHISLEKHVDFPEGFYDL